VTRYGALLPSALLPGRLLGPSLSAGSATPPRQNDKLGSPGRPSPIPTLLIAVFDNSGSVARPGGNDPLSNRYAEVRRALSAVARKGSRRELGAIVHFDTPSSGEVTPTPITRSGLVRLRAGLRPPADGAGTSELGPSLDRAYEFAEALPDHQATLVVLSDFELFDTNLAEVRARLAAFPGDVHAVVLGSRLRAGGLDRPHHRDSDRPRLASRCGRAGAVFNPDHSSPRQPRGRTNLIIAAIM